MGFAPEPCLKAKGSVTALDFLPDDRQVVVWSGHPPIRAHYLGATTTVSTQRHRAHSYVRLW